MPLEYGVVLLCISVSLQPLALLGIILITLGKCILLIKKCNS